MSDEYEMLARWEGEGGFSPSESGALAVLDPQSNQYDISSQKVRRCVVCGDDRAAPKISDDGKNWRCLVHLPKLGQSQRRRVMR